MADAPAAVLGLPDLGEALVSLERVAAGRDEIDRGVEVGARQAGVRRRRLHLAIELIGDERLAAGRAEHMLRQHVERASAQRRRILRVIRHRADRGAAFQHLEAIGRHENAARRLVEPVVGAADPLQQARRAFRRADVDDEIDVAPVDAKIERRGADHRAQLAARHGVLDFAALLDVERAVMQSDGERVVVEVPERVEDHLRLAAGVDEHQRHLVLLDQLIDLRERVARRMPGPWQIFARLHHSDLRLRAAVGNHQVGTRLPMLGLRNEKARQVLGLGNGRRQSDGRQSRRQPEQPCQSEREQIAALAGDQRMQLIEHHALERAEQIRRIGRGEQQRELLRRGQHDVGRIAALALAFRCGRVAGARLDADRQFHLRNRRFEVARDVHGQRLER